MCYQEHFSLGTSFKVSILSNAERSGACIEGCGLAKIRRVTRILRYDFRFAPITQDATSQILPQK
jgi:hypothetical protein